MQHLILPEGRRRVSSNPLLPFIAQFSYILVSVNALPDLFAQAVKLKNAMRPSAVVAILELITQQVQKLNLLLSRQRRNSLSECEIRPSFVLHLWLISNATEIATNAK